MGNWSSYSENLGRFDAGSEDYSDPRTIPPTLHFSATPIAHALIGATSVAYRLFLLGDPQLNRVVLCIIVEESSTPVNC